MTVLTERAEQERPTRYYVGWQNNAAEAAIVRRTGCRPEDVDSALTWDLADAKTLAGAKSKARTIRARGVGWGVTIYERNGLYFHQYASDPMFGEWRWDEEMVSDEYA